MTTDTPLRLYPHPRSGETPPVHSGGAGPVEEKRAEHRVSALSGTVAPPPAEPWLKKSEVSRIASSDVAMSMALHEKPPTVPWYALGQPVQTIGQAMVLGLNGQHGGRDDRSWQRAFVKLGQQRLSGAPPASVRAYGVHGMRHTAHGMSSDNTFDCSPAIGRWRVLALTPSLWRRWPASIGRSGETENAKPPEPTRRWVPGAAHVPQVVAGIYCTMIVQPKAARSTAKCNPCWLSVGSWQTSDSASTRALRLMPIKHRKPL